MSTSYNFEVAKTALSDTDKNRILCIFLNSTQTTVDWDKATRDFGAASVDSMRVMHRSALKKIEKAGGLEGETPKRGRKRKDATEEDGETPATPKKRGRKAKVADTDAAVDDVKDEEDVVAKEEPDAET